jgi:hypothetical protein
MPTKLETSYRRTNNTLSPEMVSCPFNESTARLISDLPVPCLRRANALAYTDAEEDSERLLNFMDDVSSGFVDNINKSGC